MSDIYQLAYYSQATEPFSEAQLLDLLQVAREKNRKLGISGILIYNRGCFLQLLEGDNKSVDNLYDRICDDLRHKESSIIYRQFRNERIFKEDWYMAYRNTNDYSSSVKNGIEDTLYAWEHGETLQCEKNMKALIRLVAKEM